MNFRNSIGSIITMLSLALGSSSVLASSYKLAGCTAEDLTDAKNYHDVMAKEFAEGRASQIDIRAADALLLDFQVCRGLIDLSFYCAERTKNLGEQRRLLTVRGLLTAAYFREVTEVRSRCAD